jgi:hypothetical protein
VMHQRKSAPECLCDCVLSSSFFCFFSLSDKEKKFGFLLNSVKKRRATENITINSITTI